MKKIQVGIIGCGNIANARTFPIISTVKMRNKYFCDIILKEHIKRLKNTAAVLPLSIIMTY